MPERFPVCDSLEQLLDGATHQGELQRIDSLSGATFSRVERDGEPYVVKHLSLANDWVMRATRDTVFRPVLMWESGLYAALPDCLDSTVVGVARYAGGADVMMRDISPWLVPEGDAAFPLALHEQVLDHMAGLHAAFWDWSDEAGLCPPADRWTFLSLRTAEAEQAGSDPVPAPPPASFAK